MNEADAVRLLRKELAFHHHPKSTEDQYVAAVRLYCRWLKVHGSLYVTREERIKAYLSTFAARDAAASTQNGALFAILYLYQKCMKVEVQEIDALRCRRPVRERYCPTRAEVAAVLKELQDVSGYPTRLMGLLIYGCGLRLADSVGIRLRDVDLANSRLTIHGGKGDKDRVVPIPCCLAEPLKRQIAVARVVADQDRANGVPVFLPGLLAKKYPSYPFAASWAWLFPLRTLTRHWRSGLVGRWHCLDQAVQRAFRLATGRVDLRGVVTPHSLRHAFVTHALDAGAAVHDVQKVCGHSDPKTTMGYAHAEVARVRSPLDSLAVAA